MRLIFRVVFALAFMVGASSCSSTSDGPTASASSVTHARLAISPTFSAAAARAYTVLAASGADITKIHIVLSELTGRVALDTLVAFPVGTDTIAIVLPVSIQGREEQFDAQIDLLDANNVVQFAITQRITARNASLPPVPQVPLVLQYVGPGSAAKSIAVSPGDGTLLPKATVALIATGADARGLSIADLAIVWTSSDPTIVSITPTGPTTALATAVGPRGVATITAKTLSGAAGTAKVTVVPQAAGLSVFGGGGQTSAALDTLGTPFTVELRGTDGGVMSGVLVTFSAVTPGGDVVTANTPTDALGHASTRMVLGRDSGTYTYQAASGSLAPVTVSATATPATVGPAVQLIPLTPLPASFKAGVAASQQFSAQLADAKGYYVRTAGVVLNATLDITTASGSKSQQSVRTTSDANGVISLPLPTFDTAGTVVITITVPALNVSFSGTFTIN